MTADLFEYLAEREDRDVAESVLQSRFEDFHRKNPRVYQTIVRLAREARAVGQERVGIGMIYEVCRWQISMTTTDKDFKLNNNHRSRYARLVMASEPDLAGVFETRELRA